MTSEWLACLIPAAIVLALAALARVHHRTWLNPGAFFALVWTFGLWVPLIVAPDFIYWSPAAWYILLFLASAVLGSLLGTVRLRPAYAIRHEPPVRRTSEMAPVVLACSLVALGGVGYLVVSYGRTLAAFLSFAALSALGQQLTQARYELLAAPPLAVRVSTGIGLFGALVGGTLFVVSGRRSDRIIAVLPLLPGVLMAAVTTGKGNLLTPMLLWLSSYLAASVHRRTIDGFFTTGRLVRSAALGVLLLGFFSVVQMARYGWTDPYLVGAAVNRIRSYAVSQLSAFSTWLSYYHGRPVDSTNGAYTFAGVFDALGIRDRELGTFADMVALGPPDLFGNVYTIFRGLLMDYQLAGAVLVLFACGLFYSAIYVRARRGGVAAVGILASGYALFMWSVFVSVFVNNTTILAYLLFTIYLIARFRLVPMVVGPGHRSHSR